MNDPATWRDHLNESGFAIKPCVFDAHRVEQLIASLDSIETQEAHRRGGIRNLLDVSQVVRELSESIEVCSLVKPILGEGAFAVRGILFDKTEATNWKVPWHQDLTIAVAAKVKCDGFGPWSLKAGVQHVQPPSAILEKMLSVRIHLDACPAHNGALKVIPGSHRRGRRSEHEAAEMGSMGPVTVCEVGAGGVALMRPLLVHSSSASEQPGHRRVIHLDFASSRLPGELRWLHQPRG